MHMGLSGNFVAYSPSFTSQIIAHLNINGKLTLSLFFMSVTISAAVLINSINGMTMMHFGHSVIWIWQALSMWSATDGAEPIVVVALTTAEKMSSRDLDRIGY